MVRTIHEAGSLKRGLRTLKRNNTVEIVNVSLCQNGAIHDACCATRPSAVLHIDKHNKSTDTVTRGMLLIMYRPYLRLWYLSCKILAPINPL
jgi:hypothetical protein